MIEATLELIDREVQWVGEAIPRKGDHIFWDDSRFEVVQVQWHCSKPRGVRQTRALVHRVRIIAGGPIR